MWKFILLHSLQIQCKKYFYYVVELIERTHDIFRFLSFPSKSSTLFLILASKHLWNEKDEMHMKTFFVDFRLVEKELIYWSKISYSLITLHSNVLITARSRT